MRIKRASEKILGRPGSAHVIRHSVGTETQKRTGDIFFTAQYLGHKSVQTTIDIYCKDKIPIVAMKSPQALGGEFGLLPHE